MRIELLVFEGFEWDSGNLKKAQKHGLSISEIETFFENELLILKDSAHSSSEERYIAAGKFKNKKPGFIAFTWRLRTNLKYVRVISARFMHAKESRIYENLKKSIQKKQNR